LDGDCVFCKVVLGEVPARVVYEDELVMAFDDIAPQAPVHTLIIPRSHHEGLGDGVSASLAAALFLAIPTVADLKGVAGTGYRVIINSGRDANQTVSHLHIHVLGGKRMSHRMLRFTEETEQGF
jgi:histidine triad (HIT) family protein